MARDGGRWREITHRLLVDDEERLDVTILHVAEDLVHLVLAEAHDFLAVLGRLVVVPEALEARRDGDELFDLAMEVHPELLEGGAQLQLAPLEDELALYLAEVLMQPLEAHLVLVLKRLEELHVPVQPPPLHAGILWLELISHLAQLLHLLLPLGLLLEQRQLHELAHALPHLGMHLAQLAVLLHEALGGAMKVLDVGLELVRVRPSDGLQRPAIARRLGRRIRGELLKLKGMVEEERLLRADDLLLDGVVKVGNLLEHHPVAVELLGDVRVPLDRLGHLEAERRELAHLAQEDDQTVRVVDLRREGERHAVEGERRPRRAKEGRGTGRHVEMASTCSERSS